jgi:GTP-binding protein
VVNKWDLLREKQGAKGEYTQHVRRELQFLDYVPVEFSSAKTGYHVNDIMDSAIKVFKERAHRFTTAQLNELLKSIKAQHKPPSSGIGGV